MFHILNFQCTFTDILAFLSPLTTHLLPLKTKQAELTKVEFFIKSVAKLIIFTEIRASINVFMSHMEHTIDPNIIFTLCVYPGLLIPIHIVPNWQVHNSTWDELASTYNRLASVYINQQ